MNKIISTIHTAYCKKPFWVVLFLAVLLTLPWVGMGEFYTKGEPREATVAVDILNTGNWILPSGYADEFAYKPPFMHWLVAGFSLFQGQVTEAATRLPSALGLIGITMLFFGYLFKRKDATLAILSTLLMLTSFEMHRSGIEGRVDMYLGFFMVLALIQYFKWEEKGLKGFPWWVSLAMACAAMVKGPVGIVLPSLVFGVYLLLTQKYSLGKIAGKIFIVTVPALALVLIWYVLAYKQGGEQFLKLVFAENFGRFLGMDKAALGISYDLGHKGPFWYYIPALLLGFMPWSLLVVFSLFVAPYRTGWNALKGTRLTVLLRKLKDFDRVTLFNLVALVVVVGFYAIPSSKRSVYIIPAYPFAAYFLALLFQWAVKVRPALVRVVYGVVAVLSAVVLVLVAILMCVHLDHVLPVLFHGAKTLYDVSLFVEAFRHPSLWQIVLWVLLTAIWLFVFLLRKDNRLTTFVFATIGLMIGWQVLMEATLFPVFKDGYSIRPFAESIQKKYDLKHRTYVMNDLNKYRNLYGLNFYLGNHFRNFEKEQPVTGYFLCGKGDFEKVKPLYAGKYEFIPIEQTENPYNDFGDVVLLFKIQKIVAP